MSAKFPLHRLLLACWLGLMLVLSAPLMLHDTASIGFWLMQIVPLLITLPGLIQRQIRSLLWLGFLVQFYFINGVLQAASAAPLQRGLGALTLLLCLTLFTAVIVAVRSTRKIKQLDQSIDASTKTPTE
jgi:uncharacterized membrane protein